MFETYLVIGIFLTIIGLLGCCYFLKLIINHAFNPITITSLNECIITIFIGIFYIFCTMYLTTTKPPVILDVMSNDDVFIIEEKTTEIPQITTIFEEFQTSTIPTITTTTRVSNIDEFLTNYQNLLHNLIQQQQEESNRKSRQYNFNQSPYNQTINNQQCFNALLMKDSMFLYSFLHCVLSLIVPIVYQNTNNKSKIIIKTLLESFLPIIMVIIMSLTVDFKNTAIFQQENSTIFDIIKQPINITTIDHQHEVNDIVSNVYRIVRGTTNRVHVRQPKSMRFCAISQTQKVVISTVIVLYFLTIFYVKMRQMQLKLQQKQHNFCLLAFVLLWLPLIVDQFLKNLIYNTTTNSDTLTEIFLSLGNLNRLTITIICYINGKNMLKRSNSIQPEA